MSKEIFCHAKIIFFGELTNSSKVKCSVSFIYLYLCSQNGNATNKVY